MAITFQSYRHGFVQVLRDLLIEHIDGNPVDFALSGAHSRRRRAFMVLMERKLVVGDHRVFPRFTTITEKGRAELARLLGDYADVLTRVAVGERVEEEGIGNLEIIRAMSLGWIAAQAKAASDAALQGSAL